ncbi:MAG TPA: FtsX-like permease family protein [Thermoanaerobaculia bacterium]|jgi:putative ABC transport system permease protein
MPIGPIFRAMTHNRTRVLLIILEIAFTLAIVTNCVNMIVDERSKMMKQSGFDDDNLLFLRSAPFAPEFREQQYILNHVDSDLRVLRAIPGVKSAVNTNFIPWQGGGSSTTVKIAGSKDVPVRSQVYYNKGDLFGTLGTKLIEGRDFVPNDFDYDQVNGNPKVVIVSKKLAELLFKTPHVIGRQIDDGQAVYTIVGVLDPFYNPYGWPIHEYVFFGPSTVGSFARGTRFLIRVEPGAMKSTIAAIESAMTKSNSGRVLTMTPIDEIKSNFFSGGRLVMKAMTAVIALLVFVTALGIIGITSLSVSERTKQIGTRRALGATRRNILTHFILENWMVTTAGLVLGIAATYGLNFLLVTHVSGVKMDWRYVAVGMVLLWVNGLIATIPPAMRGASVSPAVATRSV